MDNGFARKLFHKGTVKPGDRDVYRRQTEAFEQKFGREMGPGDPFFFDTEAPRPRFRSPEHADEAIEVLAALMAEIGIDPAEIYAFRKTRGLFPTPGAKLSAQEIREWNAAAEEYRAMVRRGAV